MGIQIGLIVTPYKPHKQINRFSIMALLPFNVIKIIKRRICNLFHV